MKNCQRAINKSKSILTYLTIGLRIHEPKKPSLISQILDPYQVTPGEFAQINVALFAHVNAALMLFHQLKVLIHLRARLRNLIDLIY